MTFDVPHGPWLVGAAVVAALLTMGAAQAPVVNAVVEHRPAALYFIEQPDLRGTFLTINGAYGGNWQYPLSILDPRLVKLSAQIEF